MLSIFKAYAAMLMRSALFWDITRRRVVIVYRPFGTTNRYTVTTRRRVISQKSPDLMLSRLYELQSKFLLFVSLIFISHSALGISPFL
jgi:hypothetical protein